MAKDEMTYNIPLRKEFLKVPKYKRAKKAITAIKEFLVKHTKASEIKIGNGINEKIWKQGIKNPPHHVKVVVKMEKDITIAELVNFEEEKKPAKKEVKEKKKEFEQKIEDSKPVQVAPKVEEPKVKEKKEEVVEKTAEIKEEPKVEKKVEKKEEQKPVVEKKKEEPSEEKPKSAKKAE